MFVAWRELRFARGRFLLIGAVVALITLLVGFLTGLAGGLASQNVSAVLELPGDRLVLQQPTRGDAKFATSSIGAVDSWRRAEGVESVVPVGIAQARVSAADTDDRVGVALVGMPGGSSGSLGRLVSLGRSSPCGRCRGRRTSPCSKRSGRRPGR